MKQLSILVITLSLFSPLYAMQVTPNKSESKTQEPILGLPLLRKHLDLIRLCDKQPPVLYAEKELVVVFESDKKIQEIDKSEKILNDSSVVYLSLDHLKNNPVEGAYFGRIITRVTGKYSELLGMQYYYLVDCGKNHKLTNIPISSTQIRRLLKF